MKPGISAIALSITLCGGVSHAYAQSPAADTYTIKPSPFAQAFPSDIQLGASHLIGMEVRGARGEMLGELEDVVIDLANHEARYAVVAAGGAFDVGDRLYPFPLSEFSLSPDGEHLVMNIDAAALERKEGFGDSSWPDFNDRAYRARIDKGVKGAAPDTGNEDLRRLTFLLDADIKNPMGGTMAELQDLVVNLATGEVKRALLDYDPSVGANERTISVSPARLASGAEEDELVINMTLSELEDAPTAIGMN